MISAQKKLPGVYNSMLQEPSALRTITRKAVGSRLRLLSYLGLMIVVALDYYYPIIVKVNGNGVWLSQYLILIIISVFGFWRLATEKEIYQRMRIIVICILYAIFWSPLPSLIGMKTPILGDIHTVGVLLFFLFFIPVIFFGKRADCGWNCSCITIRETVGYAFRDDTLKGAFWWKLRHLKWVLFVLMVAYLAAMLVDQKNSYRAVGGVFYTIVTHTYYVSFLLLPFMGNRNFCRFLCPFSALWGLLGKVGFYKIQANREKCVSCKICERECDMGIPISSMVKEKGKVNSIECMGCARCVISCPEGALSIFDVRDAVYAKKNLHLSCLVKKVRGHAVK